MFFPRRFKRSNQKLTTPFFRGSIFGAQLNLATREVRWIKTQVLVFREELMLVHQIFS